MGTRTGIIVLLALLSLFAVTVEVGANLGFSRMSRIQNRIVTEYHAAQHLRPVAPDGKPTMLLAGNSLLLKGVDLAKAKADLAPHYTVSRFVIEQTLYYDWFFGIRRLLEEGSRPSVIVLSLPPVHFVSAAVRGEYFARYQMRARDIVEVAQDFHLDMTTASNFLAAHFSEWFGTKSEIRKFFLLHSLGNLDALTSRITNRSAPLPSDDEIEQIVAPRLRAVKTICDGYGVKLVVLLPPDVQTDGKVKGVIAAGRSVGVPVLMPYSPGELSAKFFSDGFHLNAEGAELFTERLDRELATISLP